MRLKWMLEFECVKVSSQLCAMTALSFLLFLLIFTNYNNKKMSIKYDNLVLLKNLLVEAHRQVVHRDNLVIHYE